MTAVALATEHELAALTVSPWLVKAAKRHLGRSRVRLGTVVGFPHGGQILAVKAFEASKALEQGAAQIDFVVNGGALLSGDEETVLNDMLAVIDMVHSALGVAGVIIESDTMPVDQLRRACRIAERAGADYVVTGTGASTARTTVERSALLRDSVGPRVQVKAAGRLRRIDDLRAAADAGAATVATRFSAELARTAGASLSTPPPWPADAAARRRRGGLRRVDHGRDARRRRAMRSPSSTTCRPGTPRRSWTGRGSSSARWTTSRISSACSRRTASMPSCTAPRSRSSARAWRDPGVYYRNNVAGGVALLEAMRVADVDRIVFSSTAAVYGEPRRVPIAEADRTEPINPYGATKLAFEGAMRWFAAAHGFRRHQPAVLQRRRRHRAQRRGPRPGDAPDPARAARRGGRGEPRPDLRPGLPDAGRHLHPRLRPRRATSPTPTCWRSRRPARATRRWRSTTSARRPASACARWWRQRAR